MLIASLIDLVPVDYRVAFPNTSFPAAGPSDSFLSENGYVRVNTFREHDSKTEKLIPCPPYYEAPWVYTVTVAQKTKDELDAEMAAQSAQIRQQRNEMLAQSDWTQLPDAPLDAEYAQYWREYRQALRDVTGQETFPWEVVWPLPPL